MIVLIFPSITSAIDVAPIVPCDGVSVGLSDTGGGTACQACHLVEMGQRFIDWVITTMTSVIILIFAWGGLKMVMSQGGESVSEAKRMMTHAIVGFLIILSAWMIIDTALKYLINDPEHEQQFGMWNEIKCVDQPEYNWNPIKNASRGVSDSSPNGALLPDAVAAVGTYKDQLCALAKNVGIENECASLQAIMMQESGGKSGAVSNKGAIGLMQVTPAAARSLDPKLGGLSDAEVRQKLQDPMYNMQIGVAYYKKAVDLYGAKNYDKIYASYNGGFAATEQSANCPGQQKWECVWDSSGCYNTGATDCTRNTGYSETRNYVNFVNSYREQFEKTMSRTGSVNAGTFDHQQALDMFTNNGIEVTSTKGASGVQALCSGSGCTSLEGIRQDTVNQVINIDKACPKCDVKITAGTESGVHSGDASTVSHAGGYKIDIDNTPSVNNFIEKTLTADGSRGSDPRYKDNCGNTYVKEGTHWDITVQNGTCAI